jgi:hypothetical protein
VSYLADRCTGELTEAWRIEKSPKNGETCKLNESRLEEKKNDNDASNALNADQLVTHRITIHSVHIFLTSTTKRTAGLQQFFIIYQQANSSSYYWVGLSVEGV